MQAFERAADRTFGTHNQSEQPKPLPNLLETGFIRLQDILQKEYVHKSSSRFHWGSTRSHDIPSAEPNIRSETDRSPKPEPAQTNESENKPLLSLIITSVLTQNIYFLSGHSMEL